MLRHKRPATGSNTLKKKYQQSSNIVSKNYS